MKIKQAVKYFGTQAAIAKALGLTDAAVSVWKTRGDNVPLKAALQLSNISEGELDLKLNDYRDERRTRKGAIA